MADPLNPAAPPDALVLDVAETAPALPEPQAVAPAAAPMPKPPGDDIGPAYMAQIDARRQDAALQRLFASQAPATPDGQPAPAGGQNPPQQTGIPGSSGIGSGKPSRVADGKRPPGGVVQAIGGVLDAIDDAGSLLEQLMPIGGFDPASGKVLSAEELAAVPKDQQGMGRAIPEPSGMVGEGTRSIAQFLTGFIPLFKGLRAAQAGSTVSATVAGALTDFAFVDAAQGNLANLWQKAGLPENDLTDLLAVKGDDSEIVGRLKNSAAGAGVGLALDGLVAGARIVRRLRSAQSEIPVETRVQLGATEQVMTDRDFLLPGTPTGPRATVAMLAGKDDPTSFLQATTAGDLPDRAVNINLARLDTPDDIKATIAAVADINREGIDAARRGEMSFAATQALANDLGMTPEQLLTRRSGQAFNAEEALAARQMLASSADNLTSLAALVRTGTADDVTQWKFRKAMALHGEIQAQVSGMTAEAGRALSAFRIPAGGDAEKLRAIRETLDTAGGPQFAREIAERLATIDSLQGVNTFVDQAKKATTGDMLFEAWINGLLSNPPTHAVNVMSNTLTQLWSVPERYLAAGIGKMMNSADGVQGGEAVAQLFGMVQAQKDAFRLAWRALRTGEPSDQLGKIEAKQFRAISGENMGLDPGSMAARAVDLLGEAIRAPGRMLLTGDEYFKAVAYRGEVSAQAFRQAASEGLEGPARAARIAELIQSPPEHIRMAGVDAARYQTFTSELGAAGKAMQKMREEIPALRVIMPFLRTPVNLLKYTVERTPLSPIMASTRADIAAGGARRDLAMSRMALGAGVMAVAAELNIGGMITGGGPSDPTMKARLRETGWQPYSVKLGDTYYAYNRLDPLGMILGLGADATDIINWADTEKDRNSIAVSVAGAFAKNVTSKTWLTGLSDLLEAINDPDRRAENYIARLAGSLIPSNVAAGARLADPVQREMRTSGGDPEVDFANRVLNQWKSRIPGLSDSLPPRRNLWGEPVMLEGAIGPDIVSPIYQSRDKKDPVADEITRLRLPLELPARQVMDVELTAAEYDRFVALAGNELKDPGTGRGAKEAVEAMLQTSAYKNLGDGPDGGKALAIRRVIAGYRDAARSAVITEMPGLMDAIKAKQQQAADKMRAPQ